MTLRSLALFACLTPVLFSADYTTYIGDQFAYSASSIATDASGNTYVTGSRTDADVFVTKLDPSGNIVFTTTFGGKGSDTGNAIALDAAGNIWVGGSTTSGNFPLHNALMESPAGGFVAKLAPDGNVVYSSYFYGAVNGLATDASGNVYLTGSTDFDGFPTTPGLPPGPVSNDGVYRVSGAFITKLDPTGSKTLYSAAIVGNHPNCIGGSSCFLSDRNTVGVAIALDPAGDAFITGNTNTTDLPITAGGLAGVGGFAAKINAAGNQLEYLTYLSVGGPPESAISTASTAIAADASGNAYITGFTNDPALPATAGAFQTTLNAAGQSANAFAVKLNPSGDAAWATFLGGPGPDGANSIALDGSGEVWLTGTNGADFPSTSPWFALARGDFVAELSADGSKLRNAMELPMAGEALAFDPSGLLHVASQTALISTISLGQPFTPRISGIMNAAQGYIAGRIAPGEIISIFGFGLGPATPATAAPQNGVFPTSLSGVQVLVNGTAIPLLYVSTYQINAEIPSTVNQGDATFQVMTGAATLPDFRTSVDPSIFGIFTNPDGSAKAINQDGTVNSLSHPAPAGSIVSMWGTGFGTTGPPVSGAVSTAADNWCSFCQVSGRTVEYGGTSPGLIDGMMQINFVVPSDPYFSFSLGDNAFIWVQ